MKRQLYVTTLCLVSCLLMLSHVIMMLMSHMLLICAPLGCTDMKESFILRDDIHYDFYILSCLDGVEHEIWDVSVNPPKMLGQPSYEVKYNYSLNLVENELQALNKKELVCNPATSTSKQPSVSTQPDSLTHMQPTTPPETETTASSSTTIFKDEQMVDDVPPGKEETTTSVVVEQQENSKVRHINHICAQY